MEAGIKPMVVRRGAYVWRRRRSPWRAVAVALVLLVIVVVGISLFVGWSLTHPPRRPVSGSPADYGLAYEAVAFPASDGVMLRGWYVPADDSSRTIIFAHGYRGNRLTEVVPALELARSLVDTGFNVLMFDFRNAGESDGHVTTLGYHEVKDIHGALAWLKAERPSQAQHVGLMGFSMGAATSLLAAAQEPALEAVIADSPFSDLRSYLTENMPVWTGLPNVPFTWMILTLVPPLIGVDLDMVSPMAAMPRLTQPVLLIHAIGDSVIPASESERLAAAGRPGAVELWVAPGIGHVGARQADPAVYDARVIAFFREALGDETR